MRLQTLTEILKELPQKCEVRHLIILDNKLSIKITMKNKTFEEFEKYIRDLFSRVELDFVFNKDRNEVEVLFQFKEVDL